MPVDPLVALRQAVEDGDAVALRRLLERVPELVEVVDEGGRGLVQQVVDRITNDGALPPRRSEAHRPLLDVALAAGAPSDRPHPDTGLTALHTAARSGDAELCAALLAAGAPPDAGAEDVTGAPLHHALFYGQTAAADVVRLPDASPREAAGLGDLDALRACFDAAGTLSPASLRRYGFLRPSLHFPDWIRSLEPAEVLGEALTWAARNGQGAVVDDLLSRGVPVDGNPYRGTALLWATYSAEHAVIRQLVAAGADPSLPHDFGGTEHGHGATALHLAAQHGDLATVELLVSLGADPTVRDARFGGVASEWAEYSGQDDIVAWFESRSG